jgi:hypothetical protein
MTVHEWALVFVGAIVVGLLVVFGLALLLDWLFGRFRHDEWD